MGQDVNLPFLRTGKNSLRKTDRMNYSSVKTKDAFVDMADMPSLKIVKQPKFTNDSYL